MLVALCRLNSAFAEAIGGKISLHRPACHVGSFKEIFPHFEVACYEDAIFSTGIVFRNA